MNGVPPPPYVQLHIHQTDIKPPPYRRNISRYGDQKPHRSICCRCICCCCCFLFLLILLSAAVTYYFYIFCNPQSPTYDITDLLVKSFNIQQDFSLKTELSISVKFDNPNKDIQFIYGEDSRVFVIYKAIIISSGKLPAFHQGGNNVTVIRVYLKGVSEFGSGLQQAMIDNEHDGRVPLIVKVTAPVRLVFFGVESKQILVFINCYLTVDNLSPNKKVAIVSSKYDAVFDL